MRYICVYLPYFAFAALVIGGMYFENNWVIAFGIMALFCYDVKPELKIITKQNLFQNCTVHVIQKVEVEK